MVTQYGLTSIRREIPRGWKCIEDGLPATGENVLYRTGEHQALGVYEGDNRWRCSNGQVEETPILFWQPFYSF